MGSRNPKWSLRELKGVPNLFLKFNHIFQNFLWTRTIFWENSYHFFPQKILYNLSGEKNDTGDPNLNIKTLYKLSQTVCCLFLFNALKCVCAICLCKDGKPGRDSSPQRRVTVEAQAEGLKEIPKASPRKREMSGERSNATADGDSHTKVCYLQTDTPPDL